MIVEGGHGIGKVGKRVEWRGAEGRHSGQAGGVRRQVGRRGHAHHAGHGLEHGSSG